MANTIASQLLRLGVASKEQFQKVTTDSGLRSLQNEKKKNKLRDEFTLEDLRRAKNMQSFKHMARTILERDIYQIKDILKIAHELYDEKTGKRLFWILLSVRDELEDLSPDKHGELLRRSFRKSGATPTISNRSDQKKGVRS